MFEFLLLDLDDTILDFHKAEGIAIRKTFAHFGIDPTVVRLAVVVLSLMGFSGVIAYILAAIIIPRAPY